MSDGDEPGKGHERVHSKFREESGSERNYERGGDTSGEPRRHERSHLEAGAESGSEGHSAAAASGDSESVCMLCLYAFSIFLLFHNLPWTKFTFRIL